MKNIALTSPENIKNQDLASRRAAAQVVVQSNPAVDPMDIMEQFGALAPDQMIKREMGRRKIAAEEAAKRKSSWW
jgi:hypothetical protein